MTKSNKYTWLHIGLGSFHRAHQAWYIHKLIESGDNSWAIAAGNIRNDAEDVANNLASQDGKYVLETISPKGESNYEEITSIQKILPWQADAAALVAEGMKDSTKVIACTVTEGGYYLDTSFKLEQKNSAIAADLAGDNQTIYGTVVKIFRARMAAGNGPVTLLSCDNVRHNGELFRDGLVEFLEIIGDSEVLAWFEKNVSCPNTMVDRITPRPSAELPARIKDKTGIADKAPVMGEEFIQWVIEDSFITERPNLEAVGVEFVDSVLPYEEAKIRILNSSHSCIAWAGTLVNQSYIHESTLTDSIFKIAYDYVTEDVIPSLGENGIDLATYRDVVLDRFTNPYLQDTNQRVAADGFSKIPAMITPTMIDCYNKLNKSPDATAALPALFFVFMQKWHEGLLPYEYQDGILDEQSVHAMFNSADPIKVYATNKMLFAELAEKPEFETLLRKKIAAVAPMVSLAAVAQMVS